MINWRKINDISEEMLLETESKLDAKLPKELFEFILKNNHGRPNKSLFDTDKSKEKMIGALLEFNSESEHSDNIIKVYDSINNRLPDGLLPFASDPAGNFICINVNDNKIYFWNHEYKFNIKNDNIVLNENPNIEYVASSLNEFLDKLYIEE